MARLLGAKAQPPSPSVFHLLSSSIVFLLSILFLSLYSLFSYLSRYCVLTTVCLRAPCNKPMIFFKKKKTWSHSESEHFIFLGAVCTWLWELSEVSNVSFIIYLHTCNRLYFASCSAGLGAVMRNGGNSIFVGMFTLPSCFPYLWCELHTPREMPTHRWAFGSPLCSGTLF